MKRRAKGRLSRRRRQEKLESRISLACAILKLLKLILAVLYSLFWA
jgi:hypothetical protein